MRPSYDGKQKTIQISRIQRKISKHIKKKKDGRGRHTKADHERRKQLIRDKQKEMDDSIPECTGCNKKLDTSLLTSDNSSIVCEHCGVCDNLPIFETAFSNEIFIPKTSPRYQHRFYFAERMLQAGNREPRMSDTELEVIDFIFDLLSMECPEIWDERKFTKKHFGRICRFINKECKINTFSRRQEKWLQYRIYRTGEYDLALPNYVTEALKIFFYPFSFFHSKYNEELKKENTNFLEFKKKKNITSIDLLCLYFMYNINIDWVKQFGWYFLTKHIIQPTESIELDIIKISDVFDFMHANYHKYILPSIDPLFYDMYLRNNRQLRTCSLEILIDNTSHHDMGRLQIEIYSKGFNKPKFKPHKNFKGFLFYPGYKEKKELLSLGDR